VRIPAEVVPPATNVGREPDDVSKPEPVTGAKGIGSGLSTALPKHPWPARERRPREQARRAQQETPEATPAETAEAATPPGAVERRQKERRSSTQAVILDTRSERVRRKAGGDVKINIKV